MVLIISSVSGIVNVMSLVIPATVCLFIVVFFGSHCNSCHRAQWISDYKTWKHTISLYTGRYHHHSFWN